MQKLFLLLIFISSISFCQVNFKDGFYKFLWTETREDIIRKVKKEKGIKLIENSINDSLDYMNYINYSGGRIGKFNVHEWFFSIRNNKLFQCVVELYTPKNTGTHEFFLTLCYFYKNEFGDPDTKEDDGWIWNLQENIGFAVFDRDGTFDFVRIDVGKNPLKQ